MIRTGVVSFLNAQPLWTALQDDPQFEIIAAPPATLADMMERGELDLGLLPTFEALRLPGVQILPGLGVSAEKAVDSVGIFTKYDTGDTVEVAKLRADSRSRTSIVLARIILSAIEVEPKINVAEVRPELFENYSEGALMLIGDDCMRARVMWPKWRFMDLCTAWNEWTELPFVFAVWAARPGVFNADIARRLKAALQNGRDRIPALADAAREPTQWTQEALTKYLRQTIRYELDARCHKAMREFAKHCVERQLLAPGCEARISG